MSSALCDELFEAILMARQRVYAVSGATPLEEVAANLPFRLFVKREDLGPIKAYKWRGAYNRMALLSPEERSRGIVAASAGNHAQGVALAAKLLGVRAKIFMPRSTPDVKQEAVRRFGGDNVEIVLFGDAYDEASRAAHETAARERLTFVHPYDDIATMGGQGTLADECVMSGKGPFDAAFLQIGGGGMAAACACWLRRQYPGIRIYGVEGAQQASMKAAFAAGTPVNIGKADIFCDGTAVREAGKLTFPLCRELLDDIVTVTNDDVCWAIQMLWETHRVLPETSGAMGVAAALKSEKELAGKKVLTVISGANIDFGMLGVITRNSQVGGPAAICACAFRSGPARCSTCSTARSRSAICSNSSTGKTTRRPRGSPSASPFPTRSSTRLRKRSPRRKSSGATSRATPTCSSASFLTTKS